MRWSRRILTGGVAMMQLTVADAQQPRAIGAARYVAPPGWTEDRRATVHSYSRVVGREVCVLAVYADEAAMGDDVASFADAWTAIFNARTYRRAEVPEAGEGRSAAGHRVLIGEGALEDVNGNRWLARLHVFPLGARVQAVALVGNGSAVLDACRGDTEAFLASLRFPGVATVPAPVAPAPTSPSPPPTPPPASQAPRADAPAPPAGGASAPQTFGNVVYNAPAGWRVDRSARGVTLRPTDTRPGEALQLMLLPGSAVGAGAPLAQAIAATWQEVAGMLGATSMRTVNGNAFDVERPERSLRGWEYQVGSGGMMRGDGNFTVTVYAIRAGDRTERVAMVARDFRANLMTINAGMNPVYERAVRRFVFGLRFANLGESPAAPPSITPGKGIAGVWGGITMSFGRLKTTYAILFDDGTAFFGPNFPTQGLHQVDPAVEQPAQLRYWGRYVLSGATGVIRVPYDTVPLRVAAQGIEITTSGTPHRFIRFTMPTVAQVAGRWCLEDGPCLRLGADGRFLDEGAARVLEHATYDYPETPERGEGTFALRDHTLILRYDGGPEVRIAAPGVFEGASGGMREWRLSFNQDLLVRR